VHRIALPAILASVLLAVFAPVALADPPTISGFAPTFGPPSWPVTITGTGFSTAIEVIFTPTNTSYPPADAPFVVDSDTTIAATVPFLDAVPLAATISVENLDGSGSVAADFDVDGRVGLSELRGSCGETVTLTGSGFTGATAVTFGTWPTTASGSFALAKPAFARFHVVSDRTLTATVPTLAAGRRCCVMVACPTSTSLSKQSGAFLVVRPRLLCNVTGSFAIRPRSLIPTEDGSFGVGHIRWRIWRTQEACGRGVVGIDNGIPDMAQGAYHNYAASVTATRVRGGRYTRVTIRWRQSGRRRALTLKLENNSYWWWN
jgi:hypothetical protein